MEKDAFFNAMLFYSNMYYGRGAHFKYSLFEKGGANETWATWPG